MAPVDLQTEVNIQYYNNCKIDVENLRLRVRVLSFIKFQKQLVAEEKTYVPGERSGKWSELQHLSYVAFIDFNKEKMRCKQRRRSNKFYKEMANFIATRNALQCRSHHQKLEQKYIHATKIVNVFKPSFDHSLYKETFERLLQQKRQKRNTTSIKPDEASSEVEVQDIDIQTEIQGINLQFIYLNSSRIMIQQPVTQPMSIPYYIQSPTVTLSSPTFPTFGVGNGVFQSGCFSYPF